MGPCREQRVREDLRLWAFQAHFNEEPFSRRDAKGTDKLMGMATEILNEKTLFRNATAPSRRY
jgi:hypothetical protein